MENNGEKILTERKAAEIYSECTAEYVLPDYKGDIKRIMHTEARVAENSSFIADDGAEFTGKVIFDILYLSSDDELSSVTFDSDYSARYDFCDGVQGAFATVRCEGVGVRLPGPRRISARARAVLSITENVELSAAATGTTFTAEGGAETLDASIMACRMLEGKFRREKLAQEIAFYQGSAINDLSVCAERASVRVMSCTAADKEILLDGEICVSCLVTHEGAAPRHESVKIPFSERVSVDGAADGMVAVGYGTVDSLAVNLEADDDGVHIDATADVSYTARAYTNTAVNVVKDAYSRCCECENKYGEIEYTEFVDTKRTTSRISREILKKDTDAPFARDVVSLFVSPNAHTAKIDGSEVEIDGEVLFSGVACEIKDDGRSDYVSFKIGVPFSEKVNFSCQIPENASVEYTVDAIDPRMSVDGESFYLECGVSASVVVGIPKKTECLLSSEVTKDAATAESPSVVTVYYPEQNDTLFGVAKKFKTSVQKIAEDNAMTAETVSRKSEGSSLSEYKKLLIKRM